jgi:hypothetical protein
MAARFLGIAIEALVALWLSNVAQFEDKPTILRITDDDGVPESVETNPADMLRTDVAADDTGEVIDWNLLALDIKVADTSTLPARQQELAQQATVLAQGGMIDRENLLETLDWPDRKAMLARMNAKEAAAAQAPPPNAPPSPDGAPTGEPQHEGEPSGEMPPEVMQEIMAMAAEQGIDPQEIMDAIAAQMGGVRDSAYPSGIMQGNAPVPGV